MHAEEHTAANRSLWGQFFFVLAVAFLWIFARNRSSFDTLSITFVSIVLEAIPFVLIGALAGGFIEVCVSKERLSGLLPESRAVTVLIAAGLGILFPVCECAIVPVVRRLLQKGIPLGAAVAFLLGGPIVNPVVAASTAVAYSFQWSIMIDRMLIGYLVAITVGTIMNMIFSDNKAVHNESRFLTEGCCDACHDTEPVVPSGLSSEFPNRFILALRHSADDFADIARYLIVGAFFAGLLKMIIVRPALASVTGSPFVSILFMMILAVLLNLCSEADAFVAASFRSRLIPMAAQMAFMVLGPMLDIKLLLMYTTVFRKRFMVFLATLIFVTVFLMIIVWEWLFW